MLAVLSAIRLAERFDRELVLIWQKSSACSCSWPTLFATEFEHADFKKLSIPPERRVKIDASDVLHRGRSPYLDLGAIDGDVFVSSNCIFTFPADPLRGEGFWVYEPILAELSSCFQKLKLNPYVADELEKIQTQVAGRKTLGIHIRRGTMDNEGHQAVFGRITDEAYVKLARKLVEKEGFECLFVASDSSESDARIAADTGEQVVRHPKRSYAKDSEEEAIQDALVDFMGLAHANHILGNNRSTFCYLASIFRLIPYTAILEPKPLQIPFTTHYYLANDGSFAHRAEASTLSLES